MGAQCLTADEPQVTEQVFRAAVELVQNMPKEGDVRLTNDQKLRFYGLFKQATLGPCTSARPGLWNVVERYKWDAWSALGSLDPAKARTQYVRDLSLIMKDVLAERSVQQLLDDPRWVGVKDILEPKFKALDKYLGIGSSTSTTTSEACSSSSSVEEGSKLNMEEAFKTAFKSGSTSSMNNVISEDEYVDARAESPVIVSRPRLSSFSPPESVSAPEDPSGRNLTADLLSTFQTTTQLISQQIMVLSKAFQHQNKVILSYLERLSSSRVLTWPLLLIIFLWPIIVQLAFRYLAGRH